MFFKSKKDVTPLPLRVERARAEGRTQQALELIKQLAKQEPTPEHQELHRQILLERGSQLLDQGDQREALVVLLNALNMPGPQEFRITLAAKLAQAGDVPQALGILAQVPDSPQRRLVIAGAVDTALIHGHEGKRHLPTDLHAGFDTITQAFALVEKGQDDAAREALQTIGLTSPYLEWKLALRGLIAYHQDDDARALDNWQRLDASRFPARLIACFRFVIDRTFRDALSDSTRRRLQQAVDRNVNVGMLGALRAIDDIQRQPDEKAWSNILRHLKTLLPEFKATYPHLVPRLAQACRVMLVKGGLPADYEKFMPLFETPPDDPLLLRLLAHGAEAQDLSDKAAILWDAYQTQIERLGNQFPGASANLARALILERMGIQARAFIQECELHGEKVPKELPNPVKCFHSSIKLVATRVRPHELLVEVLSQMPKRKAEALKAAQDLVNQFPDHAPTWDYLGDVAAAGKKFPEALRCYQAAVKANPLDTDARQKIGDVHWGMAWKAASAVPRGKKATDPTAIRESLELALAQGAGNLTSRLAQWASLEMKRGFDDKAQELIARMNTRPFPRVATPLALLLAAQADKKFPPERLDVLKTEFETAMEMPCTHDESVTALNVLAEFKLKAGKSRKALIERLVPKKRESELEKYPAKMIAAWGQTLLDLEEYPLARAYLNHGIRRFPKNAEILLSYIDLLLLAPSGRSGRRVVQECGWRLESLNDLVEKLPLDQRGPMKAEIAKREELFQELQKDHEPEMDFFSTFGDIFGPMDDED